LRHTITVHDRTKEHQCAICGKQFALSLQMRRHVKVVHEGLKNPFEKIKYLKKCDHCKEKFNKPDMKKHLKTVHNIEMVYTKKTPVEKIKCQLCEEIVFKSDMSRHRRIVHDITTDYKTQHLLRAPYVTRTCKYCEKEFSHLQSVEKHIKSVHKKIKDQKCGSCGKAFSHPEILRKHVRNVHEGLGKISCNFCGNTYNNNTSLKTHIKHVHDKIRDHQCRHCGRAFFLNRDLRRHIEKTHPREAAQEPVIEYKIEVIDRDENASYSNNVM